MSYNNDRKTGCFSCGEEGHIAKNCRSNPRNNDDGDAPRYRSNYGGDRGGGGGGGSRKCYNCGREGHMASQCRSRENNGGGRDGGGRDGGYGGRGGGGGGYRGGNDRDRDRNYNSNRVFNNGKPTLFVANLPDDTDTEMLKEIFPDAVNWRVPNNFKGYAFIEYEDEEKMESDLNEKQDYSLHGKPISVSKSKNNSGGGGGGGGGGRGGGGRSRGGYRDGNGSNSD
ncbi:unnamed protein product [Gordionus sp. m RMFG-2023]|uniref:uncharacterized protein LOC135925663 n=1 Tax=Gordionus sp. m RMFG-2023 TaxID=3053472 RepID=UPI0030DE073F